MFLPLYGSAGSLGRDTTAALDSRHLRTHSARHLTGPRSRAVIWWHVLLRVIAVLNLTLWSISAAAVTHAQAVIHPATFAASHVQLVLSAVYVSGCAFRSLLPVCDIPRVVLIDSMFSSVIVGRSVATVAELCFAAQWALILHRVALLSHSLFGQVASAAIIPLIMLAEVFSWYAVLTTAQRGHVFENSLWGMSAALVVASMLLIGPHGVEYLYAPLLAWCIGGAAYVAFIFLVDVPMYRARWLADQTIGRQYLSIAQGAVDVRRRRVVSYRWDDWKNEVLWMTLYFALGVWSSISLVYASLALDAHRS